jgi:hypothetical protein
VNAVAKQRRGGMTSPCGMAQIGPPRKGKAKVVFRDGVAYLPDPEPEIREAIRNMRRDARKAIDPKQAAQIISGKAKTGSADAAYFAALLYEQLARVEDCLRVLLTCPAADARWRGLKLASGIDTSRFYWQRLLLAKTEKFIVAGEGTSKGGKKGSEAKQVAAQRRAKQVRDDFEGKAFARGEMKVAVDKAKAKYGLGRSQIYALIKKMVRPRVVPD